MKKSCMTLVLFLTLLTGQAAFASQISIGIRIGPPPPPRVVTVLPVRPGPEFVFVEGYWYPVGAHWRWHQGYWTRSPYEGARWLAPRYEGGMFYQGYWETTHGRVEHDHHWDKHRERDFRGRGKDHDRR